MNTLFCLPRPALAAALLAAVALSACWDGDDDAEAPMAPMAQEGVPASATASSRAYTQFAAGLPASDTAAPLDLGDYVAPTSETDAPEPVN